MTNTKKNVHKTRYSNPFTTPWSNPKHAHSQVNGETQQTQDHIILHKEMRKRG
ncbi:YpzG family protein [Bacillus sp. 03113]|uniref:YpzG family protein n=1 Tax=Bacillus sp. 03113 TaxID=2578211 RepID=UPI0011442515|nr:YpzG family protein [Bacillus sp. 03113]